ncbi:MAG: hypothetical protein KGI08_07045 [Thaumarchaeota archaeon]|nr:hypothetical protein [Nitrososphaerota archaeon]
MLALIDGDLIVYRVGYTTENEEGFVAVARARDMIEGMLAEVGATEYRTFISDSANNFRLKIFPEYKANRVQPKPKHYQLIKDYLFSDWQAELAVGQEADDSLGIEQSKCFAENYESVICSIDKDLHQIPGKHYNFVKKEMKEVTEPEGIKFFYKQLLTGDVVDNIKGCPGVGAVKSEKLLFLVDNEEEYYKVVIGAYKVAFNKLFEISDDELEELVITTGQLLWIRRKEEELWLPPTCSTSSDQSEQGLVLLSK